MIPCPGHPSRQGFARTRSTRIPTAFHALTPATTHGPAPRERQTVGGRLTYAGLEPAAASEKVVMTFVVSTRRRELWDSSLMRTHAQSRAELESPRARVPFEVGCDLSPETRLRTGAHVKYPTRYPPAYAPSRSNDGTPFSYVGDEVHRAMHRPITRTRIPARGGRRIPAESQSAPSAQSLPGILIAIVSRPHAPSIIAPWQSSGRRSVAGQPLRHDCDRRTA